MFVGLIFGQPSIERQTADNCSGKTHSSAAVIRFAVGQPASGQTDAEGITHRAGVLNRAKMTFEIERMPDVENLPVMASIGEPYPNPFNSNCRIKISLPKDADVSFEVFDIQGRNVGIQNFESLPAGNYSINFDAGKLSSGTYFIRLKAGEQTITKQAVLMK